MNEVVRTLVDGLLQLLAVGSGAAVVLVMLALVLLKAWRIRTPVYRYMVWSYCLLGIVGLPLAWLCGPKLTLPILPASGQTHAGVVSPEGHPGMEEPHPGAGLTQPGTVTDTGAAAGRGSLVPWKVAAATVWFVGFSIVLARLAMAWLHLRGICRSARPVQIEECPVPLGGRRLRLCETSQLPGPVCFGVVHPVILLPEGMVHGGSREDLRMVLAHEVAHIERRDCWANLLQRLVEAAYFFHPLVWLASRQLTQEREEICDNHVLAGGVSADDYTTLLSHLGTQAVHTPYLQTVALFEGQLLARIRSLLDPSRSRQTRLPRRIAAVCAAAVLAGFFMFGCIRLAAQPDAQAPGSTSQGPASSPAANVEKEEPLRHAGRTFNSKTALEVFVRGAGAPAETGAFARPIGRTPSATPIDIPACDHWYVQSSSPVQDWDLLAREIDENKVPGLVLASATDSDLPHLAGLRELQHLGLSGTQITDAGLQHLAGLRQLDHLDLNRTQITDAGLAHLKGLSRLSWLSLSQTRITDNGLQHLEGLTGMKLLFLDGTQVTDAGLAHLEGLTGLSDLDLSNTKVTDAGLKHLKTLSALQRLYLSNAPITDAGLERLKDLSALQSLYLSDTPITDAGLRHLRDLKMLRELDLIGTQVTDAGLEHLQGCANLQILYLNDMPITDAGLEHLKGLTQWNWLDLSGTQITDAGLAYLKGGTNWQRLDLRRTQVTDVGMEHVKDLTGLRDLMLGQARITDAALAHIKGMTGLQFLILSDTQITDAGLANLKGLTDLRRLHLTNTKITDSGLEYLKGLSRLWELRIRHTLVTDKGLEYLRDLPGLQRLDLAGTNVTRAAVRQLRQSRPDMTVTLGQARPSNQGEDQPAPSTSGSTASGPAA